MKDIDLEEIDLDIAAARYVDDLERELQPEPGAAVIIGLFALSLAVWIAAILGGWWLWRTLGPEKIAALVLLLVSCGVIGYALYELEQIP